MAASENIKRYTKNIPTSYLGCLEARNGLLEKSFKFWFKFWDQAVWLFEENKDNIFIIENNSDITIVRPNVH